MTWLLRLGAALHVVFIIGGLLLSVPRLLAGAPIGVTFPLPHPQLHPALRIVIGLDNHTLWLFVASVIALPGALACRSALRSRSPRFWIWSHVALSLLFFAYVLTTSVLLLSMSPIPTGARHPYSYFFVDAVWDCFSAALLVAPCLVTLTIFGFQRWRDRQPATLTCQHCGYSLIGQPRAQPVRCPECGVPRGHVGT